MKIICSTKIPSTSAKVKVMILCLAFGIVSCKNQNINSSHLQDNEKKETGYKSKSTSLDSSQKTISKAQKKIGNRRERLFYVNQKSGIDYRKSPDGKILGKIPLNTPLEILDHKPKNSSLTNDTVKSKTEWLAAKLRKDTVYVLSSFISKNRLRSDLSIYYVRGYSNQEHRKIGKFINVSRRLFSKYSYDIQKGKREEILFFPEEKLGQNDFQLKAQRRKRFLKKAGVSENDQIFVFNIPSDTVYDFKINNLPLIATINIFSKGRDNISAFDYEYGFELPENFKIKGDGLVYIGKENCFQTGYLKPIVWQKTETKNFPVNFKNSIVYPSHRDWIYSMSSGKSFKFSNDGFDYYLQNLTKDGNIQHRFLAIIDSKTRELISDQFFLDTESSSLAPLNSKGEGATTSTQYQWTGRIFKNKPSIIYGMLFHTFGCPAINFVNEAEPPIYIKCDNRH